MADDLEFVVPVDQAGRGRQVENYEVFIKLPSTQEIRTEEFPGDARRAPEVLKALSIYLADSSSKSGEYAHQTLRLFNWTVSERQVNWLPVILLFRTLTLGRRWMI